MRHDEVVLDIGNAQSVETEDVEVDEPRAPAATLRVPAQSQLQALQLGEELNSQTDGEGRC